MRGCRYLGMPHRTATAGLDGFTAAHLGAAFSRALGGADPAAAAEVRSWLVLHTLEPEPTRCRQYCCESRRFGLDDADITGLTGVRHDRPLIHRAAEALRTRQDATVDRTGVRRLLQLAGVFAQVVVPDGLIDGKASHPPEVEPHLRKVVSHLVGEAGIEGVPAAGTLRDLPPAEVDGLLRAFATAHVDWPRCDAFIDPTDSFQPVTTYRFVPFRDVTADPGAFLDHPVVPVTRLGIPTHEGG